MMTGRKAASLAGLLGPLLVSAPGSADELVARGVAAWERRADGHDGRRARPEPIDEAIAAYAGALEADPDHLIARIGLIQALAFRGEYATTRRAERVEIFARGRALAEDGIDRLTTNFAGDARPHWRDQTGIDRLVRHLRHQPDAVGLYLIGAYHWGLWGRYRGVFAAVRMGVAGRLRDYAAISIALDETYAHAGPLRLLGRLHHEAPRVPFFTGWIDRGVAVDALSRSVELSPEDYLGRLFWIEAILEHDRARRQLALEDLRDLVAREPRPEALVEDIDALAKARKVLAEVEP